MVKYSQIPLPCGTDQCIMYLDCRISRQFVLAGDVGWWTSGNRLRSNQKEELDARTHTCNIQKPQRDINVHGLICSWSERQQTEKLQMI